jgi:hypothetical protein
VSALEGTSLLPSCTPSRLALSSLRFHLEQPHRSMCMRRLRTDEIDTAHSPSPRRLVLPQLAVSNRQDECAAECFGAWQPSEIDWHASTIAPVSAIYWRCPWGAGGYHSNDTASSPVPRESDVLKPDVPSV